MRDSEHASVARYGRTYINDAFSGGVGNGGGGGLATNEAEAQV
jgi:hypothetical protein